MKVKKIGMRKVTSSNRISGWTPAIYCAGGQVFAAESYVAKSGHDLPAEIAGAVKAGNICRCIVRAHALAEALHAETTAAVADNHAKAAAAVAKTEAAKKEIAEWVAANTEDDNSGEPMSVAAAREAGLIPAELETALKDAAKAETKTAKKIDLATVYNRGC